MELTPGAVIAGRYRVDHKVGAGGMGEVWAGEDLAQRVKVALKTLLPAATCSHEIVARFKREAYILGRIQSDHVARVFDFIADDEYGLVLVMEFVEGDPLTRVLVDRTLTVEEAIELGVDLASALTDLHKANIIHRDLKPGNILVQVLPDGRRRAVVVDFGVSRLNSAADDDGEEITGITRADMAVGTIEYMSPEQVLNSRQVKNVADIYATGAILFRAAAGQHIFGVATDAELARKKLMTDPPAIVLPRDDELAQAFAAVVMRAIKRRPAERWQSAEELRAALLPLRDRARAAKLDVESTTEVDQKVPSAALAAVNASLAGGAGPAASDVVDDESTFGKVKVSAGVAPLPAPAPAPMHVEMTAIGMRAPAPRRRRSGLVGVLVGSVLGVGVGALMAALVGPAKKPPAAQASEVDAPPAASVAAGGSASPETIPAAAKVDAGVNP